MAGVLYGTAADVAALAGVWTRNGEFTDPGPSEVGTVPTLAQVETWLDKVSRQMDLSLAQHWFVLPIDPALTHYDEIVAMLSNVVVPLVADLVHDRNSSGRFHTQNALEKGISPMKIIARDVNAWVEEHADGLVAMGMTQTPQTSQKKQVYLRVLGG